MIGLFDEQPTGLSRAQSRSPSRAESREPIDPRTTTGLDPRVAAALAYLAWWITGLVFLVLEPENRYVRFHAMQSLVGLGSLAALTLALGLASVLMIGASYTAMRVCGYLTVAVGVLSVLAWLACLYNAWKGVWWRLPLAGAWVERVMADAPSTRDAP